MQELSSLETFGNPEPYYQRPNSFAAIEFEILRRIDQIEARDPTNDSGREHKWRKIDISALGDPGTNRRNGERKPKKKMRGRGEAFCERIEKNDCEGNWRKQKRQPINRRCCNQEENGADD